jgi:hypothetical protein
MHIYFAGIAPPFARGVVGDPCTATIRHPPIGNIVTRLTKNRELLALGVFGILSAEAAILAKRELFFHFLLVALGVMSNATAHTAFEFHQSIFDLSHNFYQLFIIYSFFTLRENPLFVNAMLAKG